MLNRFCSLIEELLVHKDFAFVLNVTWVVKQGVLNSISFKQVNQHFLIAGSLHVIFLTETIRVLFYSEFWEESRPEGALQNDTKPALFKKNDLFFIQIIPSSRQCSKLICMAPSNKSESARSLSWFGRDFSYLRCFLRDNSPLRILFQPG